MTITESEPSSSSSDDYQRELPSDPTRDDAFETIRAYDDIFSKPWYDNDTTAAEKELDISRDTAAKQDIMKSFAAHLQPIKAPDQTIGLTVVKPSHYDRSNGSSKTMSSGEHNDNFQDNEFGQPLEASDASQLANELSQIRGSASSGPPTAAGTEQSSLIPMQVERAQVKHDLQSKLTRELNDLINSGDASEKAREEELRLGKAVNNVNRTISKSNRPVREASREGASGYSSGYETWKANQPDTNTVGEPELTAEPTPATTANQAELLQKAAQRMENDPNAQEAFWQREPSQKELWEKVNQRIDSEPDNPDAFWKTETAPAPTTPENPPATPVDTMTDRERLENELAVPDARALWEAHAPDRENITAALRRAAEEKTAREKLFTGGRHVESYDEALTGVEGAYTEYLNVVGGSMAAIEENLKYVSEQTTSILASSRDRLAAIDSLPEGDEKNALIAERDQLQEVIEVANAKLAELETVRADVTRQMTLELAIVRSSIENGQNSIKEGKFMGKFRNWYKKHPVMRAGIGATLAVSGVLTGGATAPAYMAWRGVGGYMAGEGVYNTAHNVRGNRAEARTDRQAMSQESFRNRSTRNLEMADMAERWDLNDQQVQDLETFMLRHGNDLFGPEGLQKIMSGDTEQTAEITKALLADQLDRLRSDAGANRKAKIAGAITGTLSVGFGAILNRAHEAAASRPTGGNPTETPITPPKPNPIPQPNPTGGAPTVDFSDPTQARDFSRMVGIADTGKGQEWMNWMSQGAPGGSAEKLSLLNSSRSDLISRFQLNDHQSALLDRLTGRLSEAPNVGADRVMHGLPGLARDISEGGRVGLTDDQITQAALAKFGG